MTNDSIANTLARKTMGCRLSFTWLGQSRKLDENQRDQAAQVFGASGEAVSMSKKLLDTNNPKYKALTSLRSQIRKYWANVTLPYTEPGIRLLKREMADDFVEQMEKYQAKMRELVDDLQDNFELLKLEAEQRLGELYDSTDYPASLLGEFEVAFDFPNLSAPDFLREMSAVLFERESNRISNQFARAAEMAEQAFLAEMASMVERIVETLSGQRDDGRPRVFRDSMINNLSEFFDRFRALSITSSGELNRLVDDCQDAMKGITPQDLRDSATLRDSLRTSMDTIGQQLAAATVAKPARRIRVPGAGGANQSDQSEAA